MRGGAKFGLKGLADWPALGRFTHAALFPIHFRQCGDRFGGSRAMSATMAWRTDGKLG